MSSNIPSERSLLDYCSNLGIVANPLKRVVPPDYTFKFHWNLPGGTTDAIVKEANYSTTPANDDTDVLNFIKDTHQGGVNRISYHYFRSDDILNKELSFSHLDSIYQYLIEQGIGLIEQRTYSYADAGFIVSPGDEQEFTVDGIWMKLSDLLSIKDNVLWAIFLWIIAKGQGLEKYYDLDSLRSADYLKIDVSRQRFSTNSHIITYDNFAYDVRDILLSSIRRYLTYHSVEKRAPIKLTIVIDDDNSVSKRRAVEFAERSVDQEEIELNIPFGEFCYVLMKNNLEEFNQAYKVLVKEVHTQRKELAKYILSDPGFKECNDTRMRHAYIDNLLGRDDFQKYKTCFQLTSLSDWAERQRFIDKLCT